MQENRDLIEYIGVNAPKKLNKYYVNECSFVLSLGDKINEITKVYCEAELIHFEILGDDVVYYVAHIKPTIEYIANKESFSVSIKDFKFINSKTFKLEKNHRKENVKLYIRNIKGRLLKNLKFMVHVGFYIDFS